MADDVSVGMTGPLGGFPAWVRRYWGKAVALLAVVGVIAWFIWPEGTKPLPAPTTAPVVRGDIEQLIAASGTLKAGNAVDIGAQVSGQLKKLHVRLGDIVWEGELLAEIDDFIPQIRVAAAEANLEALEAASASQQASLALSRGELERQERLMKERATTQVEYDRAVLSLSQAEANLARHFLQIEQAQAGVEEARALLNFTRVTAPADGTIVNIFAQEGQTLNAAQATPTILRIGDLRKITVGAQISEADMRRMAAGMAVYFTTPADGDRRWHGVLKEISPIPQGPGRLGGLAQFDALVEVDNADGALLPGMTAKAFFVTAAARDVLKVPQAAVTFTDGALSAAGQYALQMALPSTAHGSETEILRASRRSPNGPANDAKSSGSSLGTVGRAATVLAVGANGEMETRAVRVGASNDVEVEVLSGLEKGERVVTGIPQTPMPQLPSFLGN